MRPTEIRAVTQSTRWLVMPPEPVATAPVLVEQVVGALLGNDIHTARQHVRSIDRTALWTLWFDAGMEWARRHRSADHLVGTRSASAPTPAVVRQVFERDGWRCRYCDLRVIDRRLLSALGAVLPAEFPWTDRNASSHPAGLLLAATPDHVVPMACGGDTTPNNLVTACGTCQYNKGSCTIDELSLADPRARQPASDGWRGLTESVASVAAMDRVPPGNGTPIDFELEHLIAYGRTTGQLPAVNQPDLVDKLVRVYEAALPRPGA